MSLEPIRSAVSFGTVEDTSLALPSDHTLRKGERRVLDQVHTIKRSKSRQSRSGSLSPTSPQTDATFSEFRSFKFSPTKINGNLFSKNNSNVKTAHVQTSQSRSYSMGKVRRQVSQPNQWEQRYQTTYNENGMKPSQSDPALVRSKSGTLPPRLQRSSIHSVDNSSSQAVGSCSSNVVSNKRRFFRAVSSPSSGEYKTMVTKGKNEFVGANGSGSMAEMTIKEAVEYLSSDDKNVKLRGASFIQHNTFKEDQAKQEVLQLHGIPPLVSMLRSPDSQIQQTATAALRNLVFKDSNNKQEVQRCNGIEEALTLLRNTDSSETQRQLTGLLWNLSSADSLKPMLIQSALPVLTKNVLVPFTSWSDSASNKHIDPEVFGNTTGCLRNLSCAKMAERRAMRSSPGLIESLVCHMQNCVARDNPDDTAVENCACILHNLTYQLETEAADHFSALSAPSPSSPRSPSVKKSSGLGCFSPQSSKIDQENPFEYSMTEEVDPKGLSLLHHSKTIQTYLTLLDSSQKSSTMEACAGALQNLTASKGRISSFMSQTIVQKLNGLQHIVPLLQTSNPSLQKTIVSLVGNLSRNPALQSTLAQQAVPGLAAILSSSANSKSKSDDTLAMACCAFHSLLLAEPEVGKKVLNDGLVNSLNDLSNNCYFPKASKAASVLLYGLWSEKEIQAFLKKQRMSKSVFVNDITSHAHKSVQVIE